jgi:hypothetical protein
MKINNFALIIGSMKSGTTSIFNYLSQHPQIAGSRRKEPNFFSDDENWNKGFEWYLQEWQDWNPQKHKIALEATINYTKYPVYPNAAERIYQLTDRANFKFIYVMRNPIERIESQYTYELGTPNKDKRITFLSKKDKSIEIEIDEEILETSKYAKQLDEYYKLFPKDTILIINFDDFKNNTRSVLKKICQFFDVNENYEFKNIEIIHNPTANRIINDPIWHFFRKIKPLRKVVNKIIPEPQKKSLHGLLGTKVKKNFQLTQKQKDFILEELKEDLLQLKYKYNFDLSHWDIDIWK